MWVGFVVVSAVSPAGMLLLPQCVALLPMLMSWMSSHCALTMCNGLFATVPIFLSLMFMVWMIRPTDFIVNWFTLVRFRTWWRREHRFCKLFKIPCSQHACQLCLNFATPGHVFLLLVMWVVFVTFKTATPAGVLMFPLFPVVQWYTHRRCCITQSYARRVQRGFKHMRVRRRAFTHRALKTQ